MFLPRRHGDRSIAHGAWRSDFWRYALCAMRSTLRALRFALCAMRFVGPVQRQRGERDRPVGIRPLTVAEQAAPMNAENPQCRIDGGQTADVAAVAVLGHRPEEALGISRLDGGEHPTIRLFDFSELPWRQGSLVSE